MLRYTANGVTTDQARIMGCDAQDITIYVSEVREDGNEEVTDETIDITGPTPDVDAIENLLAEAGWRVVGDFDADWNQVWAIVERITHEEVQR